MEQQPSIFNASVGGAQMPAGLFSYQPQIPMIAASAAPASNFWTRLILIALVAAVAFLFYTAYVPPQQAHQQQRFASDAEECMFLLSLANRPGVRAKLEAVCDSCSGAGGGSGGGGVVADNEGYDP